MPPAKKAKSIEGKVVKDLIVNEGGMGTNKLRIIRWIVDGKDTGALLEKRNFYTTKDGEERMGKAKGFNMEDLNHIKDNWDEVVELMKKN